MRRCACKYASLALCCKGYLNPASPTQFIGPQRIEVLYRAPVSGRYVTHLHSHSVHRVENFYVVRLEALLLSHHVAAGPSETMAVPPYCFLGWAGQRAPVCLFYTKKQEALETRCTSP